MRLFPLLLFCSTICAAQQKAITDIAGGCSTTNLKKNLYYLASAKMEGRAMGSKGDVLAANYVAAAYKANGLTAPYDKNRSYFQSITAILKQDKATLTINNKRFDIFDGWQLYPSLPADLKDMPVILANHTSPDDFYRDLPQMEVREKAVVLNGVLMAKFFKSGIDSLSNVLTKRGALAIIWSSPSVSKVLDRQRSRKFIPQYVQPQTPAPGSVLPLPEIALSPERLKTLLAADNLTTNTDGTLQNPGDKNYRELKTIVSVELNRQFKETHAPNVIGMIKGTDTSLASVVISAHHDHDGVNGKEIYYGAVDNASGTVAVMEIAAMMNRAVKQGLRPKRTIVFASFTGEERGLLGSAWYVAHPVQPMEKTYAVLNIDMMGRPDTIHVNHKMADSTNYAYILVKDTLNRGLRDALYGANDASTKLTLDTHYEAPQYIMRRLTGSDQYYFYLKGVPFIRIDCGFSTDYHKPTDTPDRVNYSLLTKQTQLAFVTLWNLANK
ncbi:M28 family metallopeptidase [Mucilaginibacter pedocola]|uniref:Peptidase M28 domain-containing protein n=1 Tax=Mucilaginibacter pedocola TaxID=1792845 RepID=A0A1S9PK83_9SPHI|nr:M28 family peptidase [Mucilaginibacter pedocola]OOQ61357.1 hypothetical protein BC343_20490 [Mucilaginibacter pedocola]